MIESAVTALQEVEAEFFLASADRRRVLFQRITDLCVDLAPRTADDLLNAFDKLICTLTRNMESGVRFALSQKLSTLDRAPMNVLHMLAEDEFEVAWPILKSSPLVREEVLVRVAQRGDQRCLRAIAQRPSISSGLCDILVQKGTRKTLVLLVSNPGAQFTDYGFELVTQKAGEDIVLQVVLTKRKDLPPNFTHRLGLLAEIRVKRQQETAEPGIALPALADPAISELERRYATG